MGGNKTMDDNKTKKQCVWIVRYGLTKSDWSGGVGPYDSELDMNEGMEHAKRIASKIRNSGVDKPKIVYCSPFLRTAHTAQLIALDLKNPTVRVEEGLIEWQIPSLLQDKEGCRVVPKDSMELAEKYGTIDVNYKSVNPVAPDNAENIPKGAPHYIETEDDLLVRCATTLDRILELHSSSSISGSNQKDDDSVAIVSHAPCAQAIALHLEGKGVDNSKLGPWPLGGITKFSRTITRSDSEDGTSSSSSSSFGDWKMECYGDTEHMPGKYQVGMKEWCLPCLAEGTINDGASFDGDFF